MTTAATKTLTAEAIDERLIAKALPAALMAELEVNIKPYSGGGWTVSVTFLADELAAEADALAFLNAVRLSGTPIV